MQTRRLKTSDLVFFQNNKVNQYLDNISKYDIRMYLYFDIINRFNIFIGWIKNIINGIVKVKNKQILEYIQRGDDIQLDLKGDKIF